MHSEIRRPSVVRLDRYVERLDERLRVEVPEVRRFRLPRGVHRFIRAIRIRAMALLQGGAMALTALSVIIAVGIAPAEAPPGAPDGGHVLAAPSMGGGQSLIPMKAEGHAAVAIVGTPTVELSVHGILE